MARTTQSSNFAPNVLIVDDDRHLARSLARVLIGWEMRVAIAESLSNADLEAIDVLIFEPAVLGDAGLELLRQQMRDNASLTAIALTVDRNRDADALRAGAAIVLRKPVEANAVREAIVRAVQRSKLIHPKVQAPGGEGFGALMGRDRRMRKLFDLVDAVATGRSTVLIVGESGTGKSALARVIHERSTRGTGPFVSVSCGALSETLLESELFGHVKGAFTDALSDKPGRFGAADGGTIFLDEIHLASPLLQAKLLRVLQDKSFEPVGSEQTKTVDVRVLLASNVDLRSLVASGDFREDLFYRVNGVAFNVPPLRERGDDIALLAEHFLADACASSGRTAADISAPAMAAIRAYAWPGNVRELQNTMTRAALLARHATIEVADLGPEIAGSAIADPVDSHAIGQVSLEEAMRAPERQIIEAALARNGWCRQATARELGIERTTLYKKMRKHELGEDRDVA